TELPPVRPHTTEHRRNAVRCPHCRHVTRAPYDASKIPSSPFGPRLMALIALLTGFYHLSRRRAQGLLSDVLGISVSLGAISAVEERVSDAMAPAVDEVWDQVVDADVKHTDGTSWLQAGTTKSLWTIATSTATVFKILADGTKDRLRPLFRELKGILVSDRATALTFWAIAYRQNLLGSSAPPVCVVLGAGRSGRRDRPRPAQVYRPDVRLLARIPIGQHDPRAIRRLDGADPPADGGNL